MRRLFFRPLFEKLGEIMASISDLSVVVSTESAQIAAAIKALSDLLALVKSLQEQMATLQAAQGLSAQEQSEVDTATAQMGSDTSALEAATAAAEAVVSAAAAPAEPAEPAA